MKEMRKPTSRVQRLRQRRIKGVIACVQVPIKAEDLETLRKWCGLPTFEKLDRAAITKSIRRLLNHLNANAAKKRVTEQVNPFPWTDH